MRQKVLDTAIYYLRKGIADGIWKRGNRLPTSIDLACCAGVSRNAMLKAIAVLEKEGVLFCRQKIGIYIGNQPQKKRPSVNRPDKKSSWEVVKEHLLHDILEGPFHDLEYLPSLKELQAFYQAGFRSIKQAIDSLVSEKVLTVLSGKIQIKLLPQPRAISKICFFSHKAVQHFQTWSFERDRVDMFFRSLEKECFSRNITLEKYWFSSEVAEDPPSASQALGFILFTNYGDIHFTEYNEIYNQLKVLLKYDKPITIVNIIDFHKSVAPELITFCLKNKIHFTNLSFNEEAGFQVGKFLISRGHRKVCFFGHDSTISTWYLRYLGIVRAFAFYNMSNAVVPFFALQDSQTDNIHQFEMNQDKEHQHLLNAEIEHINSFISSIEVSKFPFSWNKARLVSPMYEFVNGLLLQRMWLPFFRKALSLPNITAWVCVEDYLANYAAFEFLKAEKIPVPDRIGLISFQDQIESMFNSVSSYRFDLAGAAISALNIIIYPGYAEKMILEKNGLSFNLNGMVIDRGSA